MSCSSATSQCLPDGPSRRVIAAAEATNGYSIKQRHASAVFLTMQFQGRLETSLCCCSLFPLVLDGFSLQALAIFLETRRRQGSPRPAGRKRRGKLAIYCMYNNKPMLEGREIDQRGWIQHARKDPCTVCNRSLSIICSYLFCLALT